MGLANIETCDVCGISHQVGKPHQCEPFADTVPNSIEFNTASAQEIAKAMAAGVDIRKEPSKGLKYDTGKLRFSLIPPETTTALAEVLTFGANKYGPNNWQLVENGKERYLDALFRHLEAYRSGELIDPESQMHHLAHALTNVAFLHYLETKDTNE